MTAYTEARAAHDRAFAEYEIARTKYHARQIDDAEFLKAHTKKKAADAAFDVAYAIAAEDD